MKVLVAVPSHNRSNTIQKDCLDWLQDTDSQVNSVQIDWKIFVEKNQELYYKYIVPHKNLAITPDGSGLIGQVRMIGKYAEQQGYDWVFKIDDDMSFLKYDKAKREYRSSNFNAMMFEFTQFIKDNTDTFCINVAKPSDYRYAKEREGFLPRRKPIYGNYLVRPATLTGIPRDLKLCDDLWISLKGKEAGGVYTYIGAYENAITLTNAGGLQSIDRQKATKDTYEVLRQYYPQVVLMHQRKGKDIVDIDVSYYFGK